MRKTILAGILLLALGAGKLVFDLVDKDFRVGTNTLVLIGLALSLGVVGLIADLLVQLNRRQHSVLPAMTNRRTKLDAADATATSNDLSPGR